MSEVRAVLAGQWADGQQRVGQADAFAAGERASDQNLGRNVICGRLDDPHADLAVIEQQGMSRRDRREDLWMRQEYAIGATGLLVALEAKNRAVVDEHASAVEIADPELRPLQVGEDADGVPVPLRYPTHRVLQRARRLVRGVAHVDPEYVDAGKKQAF